MSSSVSSHTSASLFKWMVGAAFLCCQWMGETITAGGLSHSASEASGVVNEDAVVAAGVAQQLSVGSVGACHLGGIAWRDRRQGMMLINANQQITLRISRVWIICIIYSSISTYPQISIIK
jgi:hypothetical protein